MKRTAYNENMGSILKWNQYFYYHFQYLIYIGIILLAVKNNKNMKDDQIEEIADKLSELKTSIYILVVGVGIIIGLLLFK